MEMWIPPAIVILLATLIIERTRAHRAVPAMMNRLRRWRRRTPPG
jgi:hypothetical protein